MINFQTDIAPLRQQFFPMLQGGQNFDANLQYQQKVINPMMQQNLQLQSGMLKMQSDQLAFEKQKLALEDARRESKMKLDSMQMLPEVTKRIDEVFSDPTLDSAQRADRLGSITTELAPIAPYNPAINNLLNSANTRLNVADRLSYRQEIRDDREQQRRFGIMSSAAQIGAVDTVRNMAEKDGVIDEMEQPYVDIATDYQKRSDLKQQETQRKLAEEQEEKTYQRQRQQIQALESQLKSIKLIDEDDLSFATAIAGGKVPDKPPTKPEGMELDKRNRIKLQQAVQYAALQAGTKLDPALLENASNENLYTAAMNYYYQGLRGLAPKQQPASRAITGYDE